MLSTTKPLASISLDLDDKWTYMKTHGDPRWRDYPSYLATIVPRVLTFLRERNLTITFFIVGQDAAIERNQSVLRSIVEAGHEIANHSFHHEPWLHLYSQDQLENELHLAEYWIEKATGCRTAGFRGPGFSISDSVIEVLHARNYLYDASTLPTFLGPLARAYYFLTANLDEAQKRERAQLFGSVKDGLRPLKPYPWKTRDGALLELPVTTTPVFRTPFHLSYLLYVSNISSALARAYLQIAITLCKLSRTQPSFLLHPLDFADPADAPELAFFPAMKLSLKHKLSLADSAFELLTRSYHLVPMGVHVSQYLPKAAPEITKAESRVNPVRTGI
jgi:peptidoglycan-N-acetylglucosamine deacetylase